MSPQRTPRAGEPAPLAGTYPISTGTAELVPDPSDPRGWTLLVNGVPSSHIVLGEPGRLDFEYMDWIGRILHCVYPDGAPLRALHLGAAGCSLPRYIEHGWPDSRQLAVEIDAELAALVRTWFDLPRAPKLKIRAADARDVVAGLPAGRFELAVRDAFSADTTPASLSGDEFFADVARVLGPAGVYIANIADKPPLTAAKAELRRLAGHFAHVAVAAEPGQLRGRRYGNLIAVASATPLPVESIARELRGGAAAARVLAGRTLTDFLGGPG